MGPSKTSGERRKDYNGNSECLGSYFLDSFLEINLPPESYWWRINGKRLKLYPKDVEFGETTMKDMKRIPKGVSNIAINPVHRKFSSQYTIVFMDKHGNIIEVPNGEARLPED